MDGPCENTDREIWRECPGDAYSDSIHVTKGGGIGINCGGHVIVMNVRFWHRLAADHLKMLESPFTKSADNWDAPSNRSYEPVESRAAIIYAGFDYDGPGEKPAWAPGGNSLKQDLARMDAREELRRAGHKPF